jgi:hypothetical protein
MKAQRPSNVVAGCQHIQIPVLPQLGLGHGMQWYVYLVTASALAFWGQIAVELISRPIRAIFRLRRRALEWMLAFCKTSLPRPRELAMSSQQIREYNQAVRNVAEAQRVFRDLGVQLIAIGESEPAVRTLMGLIGLNIDRAGEKLIALSDVYAKATTDSEELRREIASALLDARSALAVSRDRSTNNLMKVRVEPMNLFRASPARQRIKAKPMRPMTAAWR